MVNVLSSLSEKERELKEGLALQKQTDNSTRESRLAMLFSEKSPEKPKLAEFTSTRGGEQVGNYEFALTNAQPLNKGLWYREPFSELLLDEGKQLEYVSILKEAINSGDNEHIRGVVKSLFRYLWTQMGTGLTNEEITEVVDSLDSFNHPLITPVEKLGDGIYLEDETRGPTDAFKDLALQQVTTMVSIITRRNNKLAVEKAIQDKEAGVSYKFENIDGTEKLVKYENGEVAEEQGNRPKITIVMTQTSTSGDTGPAGGAGIEGRDFVANIIGFPAFEATQGQAGQMMKLEGNVMAVAFREAFSEIQEMMKASKTKEFEAKLKSIIEAKFSELREQYGFDIEVLLGSFNSVNIGRVDGQAIYHSALNMISRALYSEVYKNGDVIKVIPSGNFGHVTGAIQARDMVGGTSKIIASTNPNDAIHRLIQTGKYTMATSEISCPSVSMIIRYGSNVERLLRRITSPKRCDELMEKFETDGNVTLKLLEFLENNDSTNFRYNFLPLVKSLIEVNKNSKYENSLLEKLIGNFISIGKGIASTSQKKVFESIQIGINDFIINSGIKLTFEEQRRLEREKLDSNRVEIGDELNTIREVWLNNYRLICPHTANAYFTAKKYRKENTDGSSIMVSETASPWKFLAATAVALTYKDKNKMAREYEKLRKEENTESGKVKLLKMIEDAYVKHERYFGYDILPEDLRGIYSNPVDIGEIHNAKEFGELTLDFADSIGNMFVDQTQALINSVNNR